MTSILLAMLDPAMPGAQSEKARFLNIAEGSLEECRYYLILAQDLGYGPTESLMAALEETSRLLNA